MKLLDLLSIEDFKELTENPPTKAEYPGQLVTLEALKPIVLLMKDAGIPAAVAVPMVAGIHLVDMALRRKYPDPDST